MNEGRYDPDAIVRFRSIGRDWSDGELIFDLAGEMAFELELLRAEVARLTAALHRACDDGWADGDGAFRHYIEEGNPWRDMEAQ